jgi:hypothetical protein
MTTVNSDSDIIIELCEIIFYQQKHIEELENEIKILKTENSTLNSDKE